MEVSDSNISPLIKNRDEKGEAFIRLAFMGHGLLFHQDQFNFNPAVGLTVEIMPDFALKRNDFFNS
jgi:hypothetical protein